MEADLWGWVCSGLDDHNLLELRGMYSTLDYYGPVPWSTYGYLRPHSRSQDLKRYSGCFERRA